jgi:hypothetical protein
MMASSAHIVTYQSVVKPDHWALDLPLLKDRTTRVAMGAYINRTISER